MARRDLSPADAVWFYSEWEGNLQTVSCVMWTDGTVDPENFKATLKARIVDEFPVFRQKLVMSRNPLKMPHWEDDPDFDLDAHVEVIHLEGDGSQAQLEEHVSRQRSTPLDYDKPLWKYYIFQNYLGGHTAIHGRVQHSIADGWSLVRLFLTMADVDEDGTPYAQQVPKEKKPSERRHTEKRPGDAKPRKRKRDAVAAALPISAIAKLEPKDILNPKALLKATKQSGAQVLDFAAEAAATAAQTLDSATGAAKDAAGFTWGARPGKTLLHGPATVNKRLSWIEPFDLQRVKDMGRPFDATINDVLLAALTGAVRGYLVEKDALTVEEMLVSMPISLRKPNAPLPRNLGNKFGLLPVMLPVGLAEPEDQLRNIKDQIDALKVSALPIISFGLTSFTALTTPQVERWLHTFNQQDALAVCTNVPGPKQAVYLDGKRVRGMLGWGGVSGNMNLSFAIFSLDGQINFGMHWDEGIDPDAVRIQELFVPALLEIEKLALEKTATTNSTNRGTT